MKETLRHRQAFDFYYCLGDTRALPQVSQEFKVSLVTVKRWSVAFNWQQRIEQRDIENAKEIEKKVNEAVVKSKVGYRALIKKVVDQFEERLKAGKIRISKPEDLSIMAKLDMLMMGEATERKDIVFNLLDVDMTKYPKGEKK